MFLRILFSVFFGLVLGFLVYRIMFLTEVFLISPRFGKLIIGKAQIYLINNGCGYFEQPVKDICDIERFNRTIVFTVPGLVIGFLALVLIPTDFTFWIVQPWTIKCGIAAGAIVNSITQYFASMDVETHVGLLKRIDEKGICYFEGVWMPDFDFDLSKHFSRSKYPEVGQKYIVLDYLDCITMANVERYYST